MKCANCMRSIREAYFEQDGRTYGPTCGKRLGIDARSRLSCGPIIKHKLSKAMHKKIVVQDGQEELFKEENQ